MHIGGRRGVEIKDHELRSEHTRNHEQNSPGLPHRLPGAARRPDRRIVISTLAGLAKCPELKGKGLFRCRPPC
jgi:hypothetical protein